MVAHLQPAQWQLGVILHPEKSFQGDNYYEI